MMSPEHLRFLPFSLKDMAESRIPRMKLSTQEAENENRKDLPRIDVDMTSERTIHVVN